MFDTDKQGFNWNFIKQRNKSCFFKQQVGPVFLCAGQYSAAIVSWL